MPYLLYYTPRKSKEKYLVTIFTHYHTSNSSDKWRWMYMVIKLFSECHCAHYGDLSLTLTNRDTISQPVSLEYLLGKIDINDQAQIAFDLDLSNLKLMGFDRQDFCTICDLPTKWCHIHPTMILLQIIHKELKWFCIGCKIFSGWAMIQDSVQSKTGILFQIDMPLQKARFVQAKFLPNFEKPSQVSAPQNMHKGVVTLFMNSCHKPLPSLVELCLHPVLSSDILFKLLPETLKEHFCEQRHWLDYFKKGR